MKFAKSFDVFVYSSKHTFVFVFIRLLSKPGESEVLIRFNIISTWVSARSKRQFIPGVNSSLK